MKTTLLIATASVIAVAALVIVGHSLAVGIDQTAVSSVGDGTASGHDLDGIVRRLESVALKLDDLRELHNCRVVPAARTLPETDASTDWQAELRAIYERLGEIEAVLRESSYAVSTRATNLQMAIQGRGKVDSATIMAIRNRVGSESGLRDAFLFHSERQVIEALGAPHEVGARPNNIQEWTYRSDNGSAIKFLLHGGMVINAWF